MKKNFTSFLNISTETIDKKIEIIQNSWQNKN